jgi:uncharacterized membrane protein
MSRSRGRGTSPKEKTGSELASIPEVVRPVDKTAGKSVEERLVLEMTAKSWSGPVPPPEVVERYEAIQPGLADRMFRMAEKQSDHRQEMEKTSVNAQIADLVAERQERRRGQYLGFGIAIAFIVAGTIAIIYGTTLTQIIGGVFGGGGAIGMVSLFVIGREKKTDPPTATTKKSPTSVAEKSSGKKTK